MAQDKFRFDNGFRSIGTCVMHGTLDLKGNNILNLTNGVTELVSTASVDADVDSATTNAIFALQQEGVGQPVSYKPQSIGSILGIEKDVYNAATVNNGGMGHSVSICGTGTHAVITQPYVDTNKGTWHLIDLRDGTMVHQQSYPGTSWGQNQNHSFYGWDSAMNHDGTRIAISEPMQEESAGTNGRVYVYDYTITAEGALVYSTFRPLDSNTVTPTAEFGTSVAISGDGDTVVVGTNDADGTYNNVQVFTWTGTTWVFEHQINSARTASLFGASIDINFDGTVMIVGAPRETDGVRNNTGKISIFEKQGDNTWLEVYTDQIQTANAQSGTAVAIAGDGNSAVMIAEGVSQGRVYRRLNNGDFGIELYLGETTMKSVDMDYNGTSFVVGSPLDDISAQDSGRVLTYWWNSVTEDYEADNTIYNPEANAFGKYGWAVALSANGTRMISSAITQDISESILDAGKVWYHK